jgi:2'-5' RNA ligase
MRVFFGLELDCKTTLQIADWRDRQLRATGRPVPAANFHITLAFVGEIRESDLERLCLSVDQWLARSPAPGAELELNQTGYWHNTGIYWLGPSEWPQGLSLLAEKLRNLSTAAGGRRDRNTFQPHITLFRRCDASPPAPAVIPDLNLAYQHFALFESRQGRHGVSYHVIQDWDLQPVTP